MEDLPKKLFTIAQTAERLNVSTKTLRRWDKAGSLVPLRTSGNQRRYTSTQLRNFQSGPKASPKKVTQAQASVLSPTSLTAFLFQPTTRYDRPPLWDNFNRQLAFFSLFLIAVVLFNLPAKEKIKLYDRLQAVNFSLPSFGKAKMLSPSPTETANVLSSSDVLSSEDEGLSADFVFNVNVPSTFNEEVSFNKDIYAPNLITSLKAGSGISVAGTSTKTISNAGVLSLQGSTGALSLTAGGGISISGLTITNSGITSLTAGDGISVSGSTVTNSDRGSSQNIFKTFSVSGQSDITSDSNTDTFTFSAGDGITLTTDATNDKLTITGLNPGWTDDGITVRLTASTDNVGIGTALPAAKLEVAGTAWLRGSSTTTGLFINSSGYIGIGSTNPAYSLDVSGAGYVSGNLGIGSSLTVDGPALLKGSVNIGSSANDVVTFGGRLGTGTAILPINDLGADLGSVSLRFNNIYVANINTSVAQSYVGQVTFTYEPTDTTYTESSIIINPTAPIANGSLIGVGIAGYERARIDAEGDIILGYNDQISAPATSYPLTIYNHGSTMVAYVDSVGNAYFAGNVTGPEGGTIGYWQRSLGAVAPKNITDDMLLGATATASALIKFTGTSGGNSWINTGNFGVGTTNPNYKLEINGSGLFTTLGLGATSASYAFNVSTNANIGTNLNVGGTANMNNQPILNIGNAGTDFDGLGGLTLADDLAINGGDLTSSATTFNFLTSTVTTLNIGTGATVNFGGGFSSTGISLLNNGDFLTSGNIGIGISTPAYRFHVYGSAGGYLSYLYNIGTGSTASGLYIRSDGEGNLLNLNYAGSDIFIVNQAQTTINNPVSITSSGDISVANDLNFTNPTASYLKSIAPLTIQSGRDYNSDDLTLRAFNAGNIIIESANLWVDGTNVGVGTTNPTSLFQVGIGGTTPLVVTSAGNVGIGTTSPLANLETAGTSWLRGSVSGQGFYVNSSGYVGAGTTNPLYQLQVNGAGLLTTLGVGATSSYAFNVSTNANIGTNLNVGGTASISGSASISNNFYVISGNVGIGTTAPTALLQLNSVGAGSTGNFVQISSVGNVGIGMTPSTTKLAINGLTETTGTNLIVDADGNVYKATSSIRYKENVQPYTVDFEKILSAQPMSFNYKATGAGDVGYIAEDFENLGLRDLIIYDKEGRPDAIKYDRISLYLLEILKDQQDKIASLAVGTSSAEFENLKLEISSLRTEIDILKSDQLTASQSTSLQNVGLGLEGQEATVSSLLVTQKANINELGVTGKITTGLLVIEGLSTSEVDGSSISTLSGPLKLQSNSLGNLDIMAGNLVIDTKGNLITKGEITAKKYNVDESDILSASAGEGIVKTGNLFTLIETTAASASSRIFVTAKDSPASLAVSEQKKGSFKVIIEKILPKDLKFSWWVIN